VCGEQQQELCRCAPDAALCARFEFIIRDGAEPSSKFRSWDALLIGMDDAPMMEFKSRLLLMLLQSGSIDILISFDFHKYFIKKHKSMHLPRFLFGLVNGLSLVQLIKLTVKSCRICAKSERSRKKK
jgi:hypothetical protein